ncbi:MAG: beta-eliminating lyase-related protein [Myxococcota bacterium]
MALRDDPEKYRANSRWLNGHGPASPAEILASIPTEFGVDRYGVGGAVEVLETEICRLLGKPAAVFIPSGTMAQQIALRIHAERRHRRVVGWHPTSHLELHEDRAIARLHDLIGLPIGHPRRLFTLEALRAVPEPLAAVLFELPQREIGGQLAPWKELVEQVEHVRGTGAAAHLDGARLWESTPYYKKSPAEIAAIFDSVYVSFYKGIGALPGACLAGEEDFITEARAWRKRHGGTLFQMWPNAASALAGLRDRLPKMPRYVAHARQIAAALGTLRGVEVLPDPPHTNMMHLSLRTDERSLKAAAAKIARERGIFTWPGSAPGFSPKTRVVELTVGEATLTFRPEEVKRVVRALL